MAKDFSGNRLTLPVQYPCVCLALGALWGMDFLCVWGGPSTAILRIMCGLCNCSIVDKLGSGFSLHTFASVTIISGELHVKLQPDSCEAGPGCSVQIVLMYCTFKIDL